MVKCTLATPNKKLLIALKKLLHGFVSVIPEALDVFYPGFLTVTIYSGSDAFFT